MALLPNIPTSFVPNSSSVARRGFRIDFGGIFELTAYGVLMLAFLLTLGVFFYGRILAANKSAKDAALVTAETSLDPTTVTNFVRLRDRLSSSKDLLSGHIATSGFFSVIEKVLPSNVRFTSLHISIDSTGITKVDGLGVAKSFNALAATSGSFAADGHIKDAIFSKLTVNRDNSVSFGFVATLSPGTTEFSPDVNSLKASPASVPPSP